LADEETDFSPDQEGVERGEVEEAEDLESLKKALEEAKEKSEKYLANWQRAEADFINYKRRSEQERAEMAGFANAILITDLLPILDDLERALEAACTADQFDCLKEGLELVHRRFCDALEREGVERIEDIGHQFDPNFHEAVLQVDDPEACSNTVVSVVQKGYKLGNKILRPSQVVVAK